MSSTPTQNHGPHSYIDAQQKIDDQLRRLEAQVISLKSARNALTPISRLHPEILEKIFFFAHISSVGRKGKTSLIITWVSHAWRELAQNTSSLWVFIDFPRVTWMEGILPLTKGRDLAFELDFTSTDKKKTWSPSIRQCLGNLSRIQTLIIRWRHEAILKAYPEWTTPAPVLVDLELERVSLPPNLFSGICPSLQTLSLHWCRVDWDTFPTFPCLKVLSIFVKDGTCRVRLESMMKILQRSGKNLESFLASNAIDIMITPRPLPRVDLARLQLGNLQSLTLLALEDTKNADIIKAIFDRVSLPRNCCTCIDIGERWEPSSAQAIFSARDCTRWEIDTIVALGESGGPPMSLQITEVLSGASTTQTDKREVCLTTFEMENAGDFSWLEYFGRLGRVRMLSCDGVLIQGLLHFLKDQNDTLRRSVNGDIPLEDETDLEMVAMGQSPMSFQNLRVLEIIDDIGCEHILDREFALTLQQWLFWRKRFGLRLEQFSICEMMVPSRLWLHELFDALVDDLELIRVREEGEIGETDSEE